MDNLVLVRDFLQLLRYFPVSVAAHMLHRHSFKCRWRYVVLVFGVTIRQRFKKDVVPGRIL